MPYAARTSVAPQKTRMEIETFLNKNGAKRTGFLMEEHRATVIFEMQDCRLRFVLTLKDKSTKAKTEQHVRSSWRALFICIKGKIEGVQAGVETFDEAFLSHVVVPGSDQTVYEHMRPHLPQIASGKVSMPHMLQLPAPNSSRSDP